MIAQLVGTTVYTTLEPCTTRNHPLRPPVPYTVLRGATLTHPTMAEGLAGLFAH